MRPATQKDLDRYGSLRQAAVPEGHFIGDGRRVVAKMIAAGNVVEVLCTAAVAERLQVPPGTEVLTATEETLTTLVGYRLHGGLMALGRIPPAPSLDAVFAAHASPSSPAPLHVALDHLSNAENVGAILRACAAFGASGLIVGPDSASPWARRAIRVSMAAQLVVPIHVVEDLPATLRRLNAWAADIHGERRDFRAVDMTAPVCLVIGAEDDGISDEVLAACRGRLYIPMNPDWDCLNAATSAAVLLAEAQRQRTTARP